MKDEVVQSILGFPPPSAANDILHRQVRASACSLTEAAKYRRTALPAL